MSLKIIQHMQELLKKSEKFCDKDGNVFILGVLEAVEKIDIELVRLLLGDEKAKEQFFTKVEGIFVLNQNRLIEFFTMNEFSKNSYTSYTNKIGLIKKDNFIKKFDDVVLAWPHKDCILEGGQSKDDDKKNEIFYNEILSRDEIDRLFEPKALTNIKRHTKDGVEENPQISEDDNLIIKGNNLIALHSLKKRYAKNGGKVKLIYIDPPYNTGNDSFKYNDRFNHSTWLTFMKNRLEVAREFLSDDGVILLHADDIETHYLKIICDEIFRRENFINSIIVKDSHASGLKIKHKDKTIIKTKSHILCYSKSRNILLNPLYQERIEWDTHFNLYVDIDVNDKTKYSLLEYIKMSKIVDNDFKLDSASLKNGNFKKFCFENREKIFQSTKEIPDAAKIQSLEAQDKVIEYLGSDNSRQFALNGRRLSPLSKSIWDVGFDGYAKEDFGKLLCDFWDDIDFNNSQNEGSVGFPSGKKPEYLIARIISLFTNKNDIVLDYHLGSGTTCAVAHKMNRRYIGIEQMDYIEDIAVERLKKVIGGEQGGISKALNWQGGGSFIYAELKQIETFKDAEIGKLNKNMHYLPFAELEDTEYKMSEEEIKINKRFYGLCDE